MTKTPREILIGSDSDNMCLTCAIGILNNLSEKFKSNFEMDCRRGGLAFLILSYCNGMIKIKIFTVRLSVSRKKMKQQHYRLS